MFLVMCPHCGNKMKTDPSSKIVSDKRKRCVYCGKSFKIKDHILKEVPK